VRGEGVINHSIANIFAFINEYKNIPLYDTSFDKGDYIKILIDEPEF
jgi:hypothetical protein